MKFNKKSTILVVFLLGAVIFASSAFADMMLGSGYHSFKNSVKTTTAKLTDEVDNFSVDIIATVKVDGKTIVEDTSSAKYDIANQSQETSGIYLKKGEERENYSYSDLSQTIYKNFDDGSYIVI